MTVVLVTGAGGFIGRHVLHELARHDYEVHTVARTPDPRLPAIWHSADLLDGPERAEVVAATNPVQLVHLAWTTTHGDFWESADNLRWADATEDLVRRFADAGGRRAVIAGTCAEYDWTDSTLVTGKCREDETPLQPASTYGRARVDTFKRVTRIAQVAGIDVAWARLFFLFGTHEDPRRLVPALVRAALAGQTLELNDPDNVLDFMDTKEAAAALVRLLQSDVTGAINVASGHGVRIADLAAAVRRAAGLDPLAVPNAAGDAKVRVVADITRLSTEVGFDPKHELEASLTPIVAWWRDQIEPKHQSETIK